MSVPIYVLADDCQLYRNPVLRGVTEFGLSWFLCWDENEPPELVIELGVGRHTGPDLRRQAADLLAGLDAKAGVTHGPFLAQRCFGDSVESGPYRQACSFFIDIYTPPPAKLFARCGVGRRQPSGGECVVFACGGTWG